MKAVHLNAAAANAAVGTTKLYGNPDVPEEFDWPCIVDEDDIYDLAFMGQINLAEIASVLPDAPLPKAGMLYFFYDLDAMAFSPFDETAARVIFCPSPKSLEELSLEDEDGNSLSNPVIGLAPAADEAKQDAGHRLLGLPMGYDTADYPRPIQGWLMLLQIDSTDSVPFEDNGALCFFIAPEKLTAGDFSDVRVMIVSRN